MSWEALRLTSKSPSEVFAVLGPHGVEELLTKARDACWRQTPEEQRTMASVRVVLDNIFRRNINVWLGIKRPTPEAFFQDLAPNEADHFIRQALVTCWMMMPRTGGREVKDAVKIVRGIFGRMMEAWEADYATFSGEETKKRSQKKKVTRKSQKPGAKSKKRKKTK